MKPLVRPFQTSKVLPPESLASFRWPNEWQAPGSQHEYALTGQMLPTAALLPIDLEIGCGVGWHPIRYAKENPTRRLVAIEHTREKFERLTSRLKNHSNLNNLICVHADAVRWITHALPLESVARCFILYPNLEPKARNKRWFCMPFFERLLECLQVDGIITLATNDESYAIEAQEMAREHWGLEVIDFREISKNDLILSAKGSVSLKPATALPRNERNAHAEIVDPIPRSHFERKYLERGEACYNLIVRKSEQSRSFSASKSVTEPGDSSHVTRTDDCT